MRRDRVSRTARWLGLVLLHLLVALAAAVWLVHASAPAAGSQRQRTITLVVSPAGGADVRVEAQGACGATCGIAVRWTSSVAGRPLDVARGIVAYLEVERDVPVLVTAEVSDRTGVIGRGRVRFLYDGSVRRLVPPVAPASAPAPTAQRARPSDQETPAP